MNDGFNCGNRLLVTFDCRGLDPVNRDGVVGAEIPHLPELVQLPEVDEARLVRAGPDFLVNLIFSVQISFSFTRHGLVVRAADGAARGPGFNSSSRTNGFYPRALEVGKIKWIQTQSCISM